MSIWASMFLSLPSVLVFVSEEWLTFVSHKWKSEQTEGQRKQSFIRKTFITKAKTQLYIWLSAGPPEGMLFDRPHYYRLWLTAQVCSSRLDRIQIIFLHSLSTNGYTYGMSDNRFAINSCEQNSTIISFITYESVVRNGIRLMKKLLTPFFLLLSVWLSMRFVDRFQQNIALRVPSVQLFLIFFLIEIY